MKNKSLKIVLVILLIYNGIALNAQEPVTDIDANEYQTVRIGSQKWMKENLRTTHYNNGDSIGTTYPVTFNYMSESAPKYQWAYNGNDSLAEIYGRLYTWYAATDNRNVCPTGWHVPSYNEFNTLINHLGRGMVAHGKLKETGTEHWQGPNSDATNESGFTGLPGGSHWDTIFLDMGSCGHYWSTSQRTAEDSYRMLLNFEAYDATYFLNSADPRIGWSIRCIEDPIPDSVKYLGLTPPGDEAEKFAPGIVSLPKRGEYILTFSTTYDECYFTAFSSDYTETNFCAKRINNSWTEFTETPLFPSFFSADGKRIIYEKDGEILTANDTTGGWGVPTVLPSPINSSSYDDGYSETTEGVMYICSDRPGGLGNQYEIWRIDPMTNQAENLGPIINSTPRNITPCIAPDESYLIYTQSDGSYEHLYITFNNGNAGWTVPINMDKSGAQINRHFQTCPKLSPDGKYLFYNSHDPAYADSSDIYWVSTHIIDTLKQIALPTSVDLPEAKNLISVFPNPASQTLQIKGIDMLLNEASYTLIDLNGKTIRLGKLKSETIDISELHIGIYMLSLHTNKGLITEKIVIE